MTTSSNTFTTTLRAGSWALDPAHSSVAFSIRHLGIAKVRGRFDRFDTRFEVDETGAATVGATVDLESFDTGNPDRDAHIRSADFLDVIHRPTLTFRAVEPVRVTEQFVVPGEATIGTTTASVTLAAEWGGISEFGPDGERHAGFSATGTVKRSDFGVGASLPGLLSDAVQIELEIQLVEPR